jgi:DNA (cytosine-5)-methyltransferase 1
MPDPDELGIPAKDQRDRRNALKAIRSIRFHNRVPNVGNFLRLVDEPDLLVEAEVFVAGTPCQDFSLAGLRAGLDGARGNLTMAYVRTINAIDDLRSARGRAPAIGVWENVPGVLSDKANAFGCFLAGLVGADAPLVPPGGLRWTDSGLVVGPRRKAAWRILDAQYFELPQRRERVFVVVSAREGFDPSRVLFEPEGVRRFAAPRRGEGAETADAAEGGPGGGGEPIPFNPTQLTSAENRSNPQPGDPAPTLITDGKPPAIAFTIKDHGQDAGEEIAPTLRSMNFDGSWANGGGQVAIAFSLRGRDGENMIEPEPEDLAPALRTGGGGSDKPFVATVYPLQYAGTEGSKGQNGLGVGQEGDPSYTLDTSEPHGVAIVEGRRYVMRKLMPIECERLQGFPDDFTAVEFRGKPAADGPRYHALGNTKATKVVRWLGARILAEAASCPP